MIAKIDVPPELLPMNQWEEDMAVKVARKLNELIEAVTILDIYVMAEHRGDDGESVYQKVDRYRQSLLSAPPVPEQSPKQSGFRPLHIEDGQVQESVRRLDPHQPIQAGEAGRPSSVPEAEPQEQERSLDDVLNSFENACRKLQILTDMQHSLVDKQAAGPDIVLRAIETRDAIRREIFAAAHREYAQPDKKECEHRNVRTFYQPRLDPGPTIFLDCPDCGVRLPLSKAQFEMAAQPGKGV